MASESGDRGGTGRRKKSAAERRAQGLRAEARVVQRMLRCLLEVGAHRGCRRSRLGDAFLRLLHEEAPVEEDVPPMAATADFDMGEDAADARPGHSAAVIREVDGTFFGGEALREGLYEAKEPRSTVAAGGATHVISRRVGSAAKEGCVVGCCAAVREDVVSYSASSSTAGVFDVGACAGAVACGAVVQARAASAAEQGARSCSYIVVGEDAETMDVDEVALAGPASRHGPAVAVATMGLGSVDNAGQWAWNHLAEVFTPAVAEAAAPCQGEDQLVQGESDAPIPGADVLSPGWWVTTLAKASPTVYAPQDGARVVGFLEGSPAVSADWLGFLDRRSAAFAASTWSLARDAVCAGAGLRLAALARRRQAPPVCGAGWVGGGEAGDSGPSVATKKWVSHLGRLFN
jgi:hypothetical protein